MPTTNVSNSPANEAWTGRPKAVVLVSGGLDSAVALAVAARMDGCECTALSFDYGQRHRVELEAARRVANMLGAVGHLVMNVDLAAIGGSSLTDRAIDVPKDRDEAAMGRDIPVTYVPARNLIFLSLATALAETRGADRIYIGINHVDYSGYPDCRPEFLAAFTDAARLATRAGTQERRRLVIKHPLSTLSKAEIVALGASLGVDFSVTHSCYDPDAAGRACGSCDSCIIRRRGFEEAGVSDPTVYAGPPAGSAR